MGMSQGAFRQADMERIIRAAEKEGAAVQIDLRSLVVTITPGFHRNNKVDESRPVPAILMPGNLAPDGMECFE